MHIDNRCMYIAHVCFYVCCSDCVGVCGNVCCVVSVAINSFFSRLGVLKYVVFFCVGDVMDVVFSVFFVPVLHGCVWYVCCYVRKKALLQCLCYY